MHAVQPWIIWNTVHSFQTCFVRGLGLKAFQSLSCLSSPSKIKWIPHIFSQLPACVTVIVSQMLAECPICQPHMGMRKDVCWISSAGRERGGQRLGHLLPWPHRGVGRHGAATRPGCTWQVRICPSSCFLLGELLGASGYNREQFVKSRGRPQVN